MQEDYVVRYGGDDWVKRSFYETKKNALKIYTSIKLDKKTRWKELIYEPLEDEERQDVILRDEVKVLSVLGVEFVVSKLD